MTGPIEEVAERVPIRLDFQIGGDRLGAGDDQAVERRVPERGKIAGAAGDFRARGFAARNSSDRKELEQHDHIARGGAQKLDELPFRRLAGGVRHVVDKPDGQAVAAAQIDGRAGSERIEQKRHGCLRVPRNYSAAISGLPRRASAACSA